MNFLFSINTTKEKFIFICIKTILEGVKILLVVFN